VIAWRGSDNLENRTGRRGTRERREKEREALNVRALGATLSMETPEPMLTSRYG
jgi:hypothetical protein